MRQTKQKVEEEYEGYRLDLYLSITNDLQTRSYFKRLINSNKVEVNGKVEYRCAYKVKTGDVVSYHAEEDEASTISLIPYNHPLDVVFEDDDFLVINKEIGISVHPSHSEKEKTLLNAVIYYLGSQYKNVGDKRRPGVIHRLDKATSGLIVFAKNNESLWWLSRQFAERKVKKRYSAILLGDFTRLNRRKRLESGVKVDAHGKVKIQVWMGRNPKNRMKFCVLEEGVGRFSESSIKLVDTGTYEGMLASFVHMYPRTGRTHQLRVHSSYIGMPIIGDLVYGSYETDRMLLHADQIRFVSRDGKERVFTSNLPSEFKKFNAKKD